MKIDHIRFYVADAKVSRSWFVQKLGFQSVASGANTQSQFEVVNSGSIYFVLCSALAETSPVAHFLQQHPAGVVDLAFCVQDIEASVAQAVKHGATLLQPIQTEQQANGHLKWATIAAWGDLTHTLLERSGVTSLLPSMCDPVNWSLSGTAASMLSANPSSHCSEANSDLLPFTRIDHVVLNVDKGDLAQAVRWYEQTLGFKPKQMFEIQTQYSALCSRVMLHPSGFVQLPINEPASPNSQIQEFLTVNQGPGIQHIALQTTDLVSTIAQLRRRELPLLEVPSSYYAQLHQRSGFPLSEAKLQAIEAQQILVDWHIDTNSAVLLQTFTQPVFDQPTFFFELIERQISIVDGQPRRAEGFGEGNFRALFEAIEREQMKRGSLH